MKPCRIDDCERPMKSRGMCNTHYERWRAWGDPYWVEPPHLPPMVIPRPVFERVMARVRVDESGCWIFTGALSTSGYGRVGRGARAEGLAQTHRVTYEHLVGPIPEGLDIDHLCRVRACCNPAHLEPVTRRENCLRGARWAS
jgi:hypothetical protein